MAKIKTTEFVSIQVPIDYSPLIERFLDWIKFDSRLEVDKLNYLNSFLSLTSKIAEYQLVDIDSKLIPLVFLDGVPLTREAIRKIVSDCPWVYSHHSLHYFLSFLGVKTAKHGIVGLPAVKKWRFNFGSKYHDLILHYDYNTIRNSAYIFQQIERFIVDNKYKSKLLNYLRQGI